jgi:hypothetical protein
MCLECSGRHRGLGVHISFVRSVTMDSWTDKQIQMMQVRARPAPRPAIATETHASAPVGESSKAATTPSGRPSRPRVCPRTCRSRRSTTRRRLRPTARASRRWWRAARCRPRSRVGTRAVSRRRPRRRRAARPSAATPGASRRSRASRRPTTWPARCGCVTRRALECRPNSAPAACRASAAAVRRAHPRAPVASPTCPGARSSFSELCQWPTSDSPCLLV